MKGAYHDGNSSNDSDSSNGIIEARQEQSHSTLYVHGVAPEFHYIIQSYYNSYIIMLYDIVTLYVHAKVGIAPELYYIIQSYYNSYIIIGI